MGCGGCSGAGGPDVLIATDLPWIGSTCRSQVTGLPVPSLASDVVGWTTSDESERLITGVDAQAVAGVELPDRRCREVERHALQERDETRHCRHADGQLRNAAGVEEEPHRRVRRREQAAVRP